MSASRHGSVFDDRCMRVRRAAIRPARACSIVLCVALAGAICGSASAHGGGLDRHGCHTNRRTGEYHCHRGAVPSSPAQQSWAPSSPTPARVAPPSRLRESERTRAYINCAEARAAGAAPVRRGEPGYGPHLDRDGDGVGCEPRRRR